VTDDVGLYMLFLLFVEYIDDEGVRWTKEKTKPSMSIMGEYVMNWKPKFNHFVRYSDVRQKGKEQRQILVMLFRLENF
jgi:hypothetical protein